MTEKTLVALRVRSREGPPGAHIPAFSSHGHSQMPQPHKKQISMMGLEKSEFFPSQVRKEWPELCSNKREGSLLREQPITPAHRLLLEFLQQNWSSFSLSAYPLNIHVSRVFQGPCLVIFSLPTLPS